MKLPFNSVQLSTDNLYDCMKSPFHIVQGKQCGSKNKLLATHKSPEEINPTYTEDEETSLNISTFSKACFNANHKNIGICIVQK